MTQKEKTVLKAKFITAAIALGSTLQQAEIAYKLLTGFNEVFK